MFTHKHGHPYLTKVKGSLDGLPIMLAGNKSEEGGARREVPYRTGEALQVKEIKLFM